MAYFLKFALDILQVGVGGGGGGDWVSKFIAACTISISCLFLFLYQERT